MNKNAINDRNEIANVKIKNLEIINSETNNLKTESIIPPIDSRVLITPTTSEPWSAVVKLNIYFGSIEFIGSGALIDEFHVLTAGHCVYDHDYGLGYASSIKVTPGKDGNIEPYGYAWVEKSHNYTEWVISEDYRYDMALLTLDRSVGAFTGYMNYTTTSYTDPVYNGFFNLTGYPGDKYGGIYMYNAENNSGSANEYMLGYKMDTYGGQSGGPVWKQNSTGYYIYAVHTLGELFPNPNSYNNGTRINQDKYVNITNWLNEDSSDPPPDLPDMVDRGDAYSDLEVSETNSDIELNIWCDIWNIGTDPTVTPFVVSYYISDDNEITTSDELLGTHTISAPIAEFSYADSAWEGEIDVDDLDEGTYYVGWIIDQANSVSEIIETNNVGYVSDTTLKITEEDDDEKDFKYTFNLIEFLLSPLGFLIIGTSIVALIAIVILIRRSRRI